MASAKIYAQTFLSEGITRDTMHMLDRTMLKELGIKSMGDVLIILKLAERYNRHTHDLCPLQAGDTVTIQNPLNRRWNTTGKIIFVLPERQYKIRVDGSGRITLRNRRFLKKCKLKPAPTPIPSATLGPTIPSTSATITHPPLPPCNSTDTATRPQQQTTHITPQLQSSRIPRALSRLLPHNKPGVKERHTSLTRPTRGGGDVE